MPRRWAKIFHQYYTASYVKAFKVIIWETDTTKIITTATSRVVKLKFHWDQFPRNFPVANVMGKSPTSYEKVGRVTSLLWESYEEAGDFQTISTCPDGLATSPTSS